MYPFTCFSLDCTYPVKEPKHSQNKLVNEHGHTNKNNNSNNNSHARTHARTHTHKQGQYDSLNKCKLNFCLIN